MNVLSLFDGMSCGRLALERAGIKIEKYYASEINPFSMQIAQKNYPSTIQIGDITLLDSDKLKGLGRTDLLIGGSPCQNLSIAVINNLEHNQGLQGEKSSLFYHYIRVLRKVNPKYFLLENVASMRNKDRDIISWTLGVEPIKIDSNLVSAQDRERYYWTNIPGITQPEDKGIFLKDIMLSVEEVNQIESQSKTKFWYEQDFEFHGVDKKIAATLNIKGHDILKRVYSPNFKCATLTACRGGNLQKKVYQDGRCRKLTPLEYERLQTVPEGYTEGVSSSQRYNMLGDGWTVDVLSHIFKNLQEEYGYVEDAI